MAIFTGTTHAYIMGGTNGVGFNNREDLSDLITNIDPTNTPFISNIGKTTASAVMHEWTQDTLATAANNANIEGNEIAFTAAAPGARLNNRTQIHVKSIIVSGTQDVVNKAGKGSELKYQVAKQTKEIARDLEFGALNNTAAVVGTATVARQMNGVAGFITSNQVNKVAAAATQADLDTICKQAWDDGGDPDMLLVGSFNKTVISSYTTGVTKNLDANDRRLVTGVDVYEGEFGIMKIIPDHFTVADDIYAIQSDLWRCAFLRPLAMVDLAKTGDAEKRALIMEVTLESLAEYGNASIINTSVA